MNIRKTRDSDIRNVSALHKEHINSGFLSSLGAPFLNILYRSLVDFEKGILLVAENEGKIIGFISGTVDTNVFYKYFLKRNFFRIAFVLLSKVFSINVIKKVLETAKYSKKDLEISVPDAELLSMAVAENFQGKGIAKQLFEKLVNEFHDRNINEFKIIAGNQLDEANKFYQKIGCKKIGEIEVHKGNFSSVYTFKNKVYMDTKGRDAREE